VRVWPPLKWLLVVCLGLVGLAGVQAQQEPTPLPLYNLPDVRTNRVFTSNTVALTSDGRTLVVSNMLNNTVSFIEVTIPAAASLIREIEVGPDPRGVALTPDSSRALVVLRGSRSLAVVDVQQRALSAVIPLDGALAYNVVSDRNDRALVSLQGSSEIVEVNLDTLDITQRIAVPTGPAGLALWGDFLYVSHFWTGDVSLVYLPRSEVVSVVSTGPDTGISQSLDIDVQRGLAYLPQTRSNAGNTALTFDTTVFPVVNIVDLRGLTLLPRQRIDLSTSDRPVNMPFTAVVDRFRNWLYIANAGSHDVSVIDLNTGLARGNITVGANPRGLLLNRDNTFLFVHNVIDGTLTIVETNRLTAIDVLPISNPIVSNDIILGAELFHTSADPRLSEDRWLSCATCHFDGLPDGRVWEGLAAGPRNTPILYDLIVTAPYNWTGKWNELQDVELKIRSLQAGTGLIEDFPIGPADGPPHANLSFDLELLVAYMLSLRPPVNPNQFDADVVARGQQVFAEQGCATCHMGNAGTDNQAHDVVTSAVPIDTPTLRYLWLTAPYFHDGSAATLMQIFVRPGVHQLIKTVEMDDIEALIAYLLSWS
jgi:YVTN family beta-propeller protein